MRIIKNVNKIFCLENLPSGLIFDNPTDPYTFWAEEVVSKTFESFSTFASKSSKSPPTNPPAGWRMGKMQRPSWSCVDFNNLYGDVDLDLKIVLLIFSELDLLLKKFKKQLPSQEVLFINCFL